MRINLLVQIEFDTYLGTTRRYKPELKWRIFGASKELSAEFEGPALGQRGGSGCTDEDPGLVEMVDLHGLI